MTAEHSHHARRISERRHERNVLAGVSAHVVDASDALVGQGIVVVDAGLFMRVDAFLLEREASVNRDVHESEGGNGAVVTLLEGRVRRGEPLHDLYYWGVFSI